MPGCARSAARVFVRAARSVSGNARWSPRSSVKLPYDLNYLRHGDRLRAALKSLHDTWSEVQAGLGADGEDLFRAREAAAMVAHGRWMYHAALHRTETRGMHKRLDYPAQNPAQSYRLLTGGLDEIWSRPESVRLAA